jgi:DcaP outer membrane protein
MASFRNSVTALFFVLCFGLALHTPLHAQAPDNAKLERLQKQLDEMKQQMADVQAQISALSGGTKPGAATAATGAAAPAQGEEEDSKTEAAKARLAHGEQVSKATATYETTSQDPIAAPRIDNEPLDPRFPGYFRLPGTQTLLRIGGYFKSDFVRDLKPAGDGEKFIPSTFPIPAPPGVNNTTISVRPTRLNLDFLIPVNSTSVRFFIEGDFFGTSSTTPRLRHAYAQVKNLLIGQTFSNFQDPDAGPDTLDFQGPNSQISIRNPQFRYSHKLAEKTTLSFSAEKPSSDVSFSTPEFNAVANTPRVDGAIKFRHDLSSGHVQVAALLRSVAVFLPPPDNRSDSVFGWGLNLSGAVKVLGNDRFVYQAAYGAGMERYVNDTSGLGTDAAPAADGEAPHLKAVPLTALYGGYQHFWRKELRSSIVYGFAQAENTDLQTGSAFHQSNYSSLNLIWNPFGSLNLGAEYLYGWIVKKDNSGANAPRIMFSAKYNFIKSGT